MGQQNAEPTLCSSPCAQHFFSAVVAYSVFVIFLYKKNNSYNIAKPVLKIRNQPVR